MPSKERLIDLLWKNTEQDRHTESVRKWPIIKMPFFLKDGRIVATDSRSLVVLDKGSEPEDYTLTPPVDSILGNVMSKKDSHPLDMETISEPVYTREWDFEDQEWCYFEEIDNKHSVLTLTDPTNSVKMDFALSRLNELKGLGEITYRLNGKSRNGCFFFDGGLIVIMGLLEKIK